MSISQLSLTLICVSAICVGQILFKRAALEIEQLNGWFHFSVLLMIGMAFFVYGGATLMWIHLLRTIALTVAYPLMALSFVAVPILSWWLMDEQLKPSTILGGVIIVIGVWVSVGSDR
ncbi:MAG: EamA family transporter [Nitrosospira sp.]